MTRNRFVLIMLACAMLAGCAGQPASSAAPGETTLATPAPATAPPSRPTDEFQYDDLIVGTVTRGGTGPCYGLTTDDGQQYALYENQGRELTKGTRIQVRGEPSRLRIDCGPGTLIEIKALDVLR